MGHMLPPAEINIDEKTTKIESMSSFTSDWVEAYAEETGETTTEYDIIIDLPHSDFFLDAELKTDFLSNRMQMKLFALDESTGEWEPMALSHWFNEDSYEDL